MVSEEATGRFWSGIITIWNEDDLTCLLLNIVISGESIVWEHFQNYTSKLTIDF